MPCNDVTEIIRLRFDGDERLKTYGLSKKTCGGGVGSAGLLEEFFRGRTAEAILALTPEDLLAARPADSELEEFLALKHFFAVQIALEVMTGRASGGVKDRCVVAGVTYDGDELYFEADIPVDLPTEKIRACGRCKGCLSKRGAASTQVS